MKNRIVQVCNFSAIVVFLLCLLAGIWVLSVTRFKANEDGIFTGIGLYFLGKAFFVGPMLLIASNTLKTTQPN